MAIVKKFRIISYKKEKSFISLENISVSFKKNHQILDNVSLNIPKGQIIGESDLTFKRPAYGVSPKFIDEIIGKKSIVNIEEDAVLKWSMFDD
mgnify:CR=1 FL=1